MFSLLGLCGLLFFIYLRPQEAISALRVVPMLNLLAALGALGLVIDVRLRLARVSIAPSLRWVLMLGAWALLVSAAQGGGDGASTAWSRILIPFIVYLLLSHGVTSFRGLQVVLAWLLALGLAIALIGVHQAQQPFSCYQIKDAWDNRDMVGGKFDGRPCEKHQDCMREDAEPGYDYRCERPGLLGTTTIGHGRVRYRGVLQDPNELALAISIVAPFAIGFWERRRSAMRGALVLAALGAIGLCIIYTQSRGGQLVYLTVLGVYFVRRIGIASGAVVAAVLAVPVLLLGGRSGDEADASALERTEALYAGLEMLRHNPLLGVGTGAFSDHHYITAHNSYLLAAAEMGLPGLFLWSTVLYVSVKTLLLGLGRYLGDPDAKVAATWAVALLASFCGLFVGIFFLSFSYHVVLFVYLGLCGAYYQACRRHDPEFYVPYTLREIGMVIAADFLMIGMIFLYTRIKGA